MFRQFFPEGVPVDAEHFCRMGLDKPRLFHHYHQHRFFNCLDDHAVDICWYLSVQIFEIRQQTAPDNILNMFSTHLYFQSQAVAYVRQTIHKVNDFNIVTAHRVQVEG